MSVKHIFLVLLTLGIGIRLLSLVNVLPLKWVTVFTQPLEVLTIANAACTDTPQTAVSVTVLTASSSPYILGLGALQDDRGSARMLFEQAAFQGNHHGMAMLLATELAVSDIHDANAWEGVTSSLRADERLRVASTLLAHAGNCFLERNFADAQLYRDIGLTVLPAEFADRIEPIVSRRVADIYFFEESWEEAKHWYGFALSTGGTPNVKVARILVMEEDLHAALTAYDTALDYYEGRFDITLEASEIAIQANDLALATQWLHELDAENASLREAEGWGALCLQLADNSCALNAFQRVLEIDPQNIKARQQLELLTQ